ncbi:MAG: hypothetical protein Q8P24_03970 [Desulfobacterales bacterium]|nr:hypothetical protein [Desulfobacterales bacterium]
MKLEWLRSKGSRVISLLFFGAIAFSCSTSSYINIRYKMPAEINQVQGKKVFIIYKDMRPYSEIFGRLGKQEFKYFTGTFSLSLVERNQSEFLAGAFQLPALFTEAIKRRLEKMQAQILPNETEREPVLEIILREFMLDLRGRQWMASMAYEARLMLNQKVLSSESISGKAETMKIIGRSDGEKVLGELFTDLINKLDLYKLFQSAKF